MGFSINIDGNDDDELCESIARVAAAFGVTIDAPLADVIAKAPLDQLVELVQARMRGEGYDVALKATVDEEKVINLDKRARRAKKDASVIEADVEPAADAVDWDAVKQDAMRRIKVAYFLPGGGEEKINKILAQHGEGAKNYNEVPAKNFGVIVEAMKAKDVWEVL